MVFLFSLLCRPIGLFTEALKRIVIIKNRGRNKKKYLFIAREKMLFYLFYLFSYMKYHNLSCFKQPFEVYEKYTFKREIGQGAYGVVW